MASIRLVVDIPDDRDLTAFETKVWVDQVLVGRLVSLTLDVDSTKATQKVALQWVQLKEAQDAAGNATIRGVTTIVGMLDDVASFANEGPDGNQG